MPLVVPRPRPPQLHPVFLVQRARQPGPPQALHRPAPPQQAQMPLAELMLRTASSAQLVPLLPCSPLPFKFVHNGYPNFLHIYRRPRTSFVNSNEGSPDLRPYSLVGVYLRVR